MEDKKLKVTDLINYLKHPLQLKAEKIFGKNYDQDEEINENIEPLCLDNLTEWKVTYIVILELIKNNGISQDFTINDEIVNKVLKNCLLKNALPRSSNNQSMDCYLTKTAINIIKNNVKQFAEGLDFIPTRESVLELPSEIKIENFIVLFNRGDILRHILPNGERCYYELRAPTDKPSVTYFFTLYIYALLDVCLLKEDKKYTVQLHKSLKNIKIFEISPVEALKILLDIINDIMSLENFYFIPVANIEDQYFALNNIKTINNSGEKEHKLLEYKEILKLRGTNGGCVWQFFKDNKLFNDNDLGYEEDNFENQYKDALGKYLRLIDILIKAGLKKKDDGVKENA